MWTKHIGAVVLQARGEISGESKRVSVLFRVSALVQISFAKRSCRYNVFVVRRFWGQKTDGQTDGRTNERKNERTKERTNERTNERINDRSDGRQTERVYLRSYSSTQRSARGQRFDTYRNWPSESVSLYMGGYPTWLPESSGPTSRRAGRPANFRR